MAVRQIAVHYREKIIITTVIKGLPYDICKVSSTLHSPCTSERQLCSIDDPWSISSSAVIVVC